MTPSLTLASRLAVKEMRHEWQAALCFVAALAGMLTPLLVVLALKNGIIDSMVARLVENPQSRELIVLGAGSHDAAFFARLAADPDVGFVVPSTRTINTQANAVIVPGSRRLEANVSLVPTSDGDPLLAGPAPSPGTALASAALMAELGIRAGDVVEMVVNREVAGGLESARAPVTIVGGVPATLYSQKALFVALPDLLSVERYRDDPEMRPGELGGAAMSRDIYPSFRIYAASIERLSALAGKLDGMGVRTRPRVENVPLLVALRTNLNILYAVIAALAVVGFWASMAASLRGMVERQRVSFSLMRLLGMSAAALRIMPLAQALILTAAGIVLSVVIALPLLAAINAVLASDGGATVAALGADDLSVVLALGLVIAATAAIWALRATTAITAEEVLRHA